MLQGSDGERERFLKHVNAALAVELMPPGNAQPLGRVDAYLTEAARPLALAKTAKRARPALLFELGQIAGADPKELEDPAIAVELMHTASLVHDDIIDEADERRGLPSVNAAIGNAAAVLVGDDLLVRAFLRLSCRPALLHHALLTLRDMVRAAFIEVRARGDLSFSAERWFEMAHGKTAVLFGLCGTFAGLCKDENDLAQAKKLSRASLHLGTAFQIADDVADLYSGADLREKNPSLPLSIAVARAPSISALVDEYWTAPASPALLKKVVAAIVKSGAIAECAAAARHEVEAAARAFGSGHEGRAQAAISTLLGWATSLCTAAGAVPNLSKENAA